MMKPVTAVDLPGIKKVKSGKVREVFDLGEHFLFVATDRISAFDCILPSGIPGKGHVLNQISTWWFERLSTIMPNHVIATHFQDFPAALKPFESILRGRSMIVKKTEVLPVECVARGYLIGSGWKEYKTDGTVCGLRLKSGYRMADKLEEPIFTPAHKAETGHDENISFEKTAAMMGPDRAGLLKEYTLRIYREAADYARTRGIIIADTKFEFGVKNDTVYLIDEVLTPDSSRFWPAAQYQPGVSPPSFDKQFVRDYLETLDWNKQPPAPTLPDEVAFKTRDKYFEAYRLLTGREIEL